MHKVERRWSFEVGSAGEVTLLLEGSRHTLGTKAEVLPYMEAFLVEAEHTFEPRIFGRSIDEWDEFWIPGGPLIGDFGPFRKSVGLYRALLDGQVVYIGKACEHANGGLRKRLADYTRASGSARGAGGALQMWRCRDSILIDLLVTGNDAAAARVAEQLEGSFIERYRPSWNSVGRPRR